MAGASWHVTAGFVVLPLVVAAGFVLTCDRAAPRLWDDRATRRRRTLIVGAAVAVWLLLTWLAATSGVLRLSTPPPFAGLVLAITVIGGGVPFSPLGTLLVRGRA